MYSEYRKIDLSVVVISARSVLVVIRHEWEFADGFFYSAWDEVVHLAIGHALFSAPS